MYACDNLNDKMELVDPTHCRCDALDDQPTGFYTEHQINEDRLYLYVHKTAGYIVWGGADCRCVLYTAGLSDEAIAQIKGFKITTRAWADKLKAHKQALAAAAVPSAIGGSVAAPSAPAAPASAATAPAAAAAPADNKRPAYRSLGQPASKKPATGSEAPSTVGKEVRDWLTSVELEEHADTLIGKGLTTLKKLQKVPLDQLKGICESFMGEFDVVTFMDEVEKVFRPTPASKPAPAATAPSPAAVTGLPTADTTKPGVQITTPLATAGASPASLPCCHSRVASRTALLTLRLSHLASRAALLTLRLSHFALGASAPASAVVTKPVPDYSQARRAFRP